MANTFEKVLNLISKEPLQRQDFEIQSILPWLRKMSKLFDTLKTDYLKDIVRNCSLGKFQKDDIIIRQGEIGDCFYIILAGTISIFIINKDKDDDNDSFSTIGALNSDGTLDRTHLGNYVTSLGSGFPFGEVALISDDAVRTATIVADEDTDLLSVDRGLYNRAVRDVLTAEFQEKTNFVNNNSLFSTWIPKYRKQLTMAMYKEIYSFDSVLVKQGEPLRNIYFIISGQVEIRSDISMHQYQYLKLFGLLEDDREKLIKENKKKQETENRHSALKRKDTSKILKLYFLGKNESIGEVEVLMDMDSYMTTAICTEKTEVLVLEKKHFERLFVKMHQRTIEEMRRNLEIKLSTRTSFLRDYDAVPLLKLLQDKLHLINSPSPAQKKKTTVTSVQTAEKLFYSHQGPLLDIEGPGSVFYMIRARENLRLRFQANKMTRNNEKQLNQNVRKPSICLPKNVFITERMAGTRNSDKTNDFNKKDNCTFFMTSKDIHSYIMKSKLYQESNKNNNYANKFDPLLETGQNENGPFIKSNNLREEIEDNVINTRIFRNNCQENIPKDSARIQCDFRGQISEDCRNGEIICDNYNFKSLPKSLQASRFVNVILDNDLSQLEEKVSEWLKKDNPKAVPNVFKLRRLQELDHLPKPGNKIVIRKRAKISTNNVSANIFGKQSTGSLVPPARTRRCSQYC